MQRAKEVITTGVTSITTRLLHASLVTFPAVKIPHHLKNGSAGPSYNNVYIMYYKTRKKVSYLISSFQGLFIIDIYFCYIKLLMLGSYR